MCCTSGRLVPLGKKIPTMRRNQKLERLVFSSTAACQGQKIKSYLGSVNNSKNAASATRSEKVESLARIDIQLTTGKSLHLYI